MYTRGGPGGLIAQMLMAGRNAKKMPAGTKATGFFGGRGGSGGGLYQSLGLGQMPVGYQGFGAQSTESSGTRNFLGDFRPSAYTKRLQARRRGK